MIIPYCFWSVKGLSMTFLFKSNLAPLSQYIVNVAVAGEIHIDFNPPFFSQTSLAFDISAGVTITEQDPNSTTQSISNIRFFILLAPSRTLRISLQDFFEYFQNPGYPRHNFHSNTY